eukprot:264256-Pleurochrysis_carterae.AAC.1
MAQIAITAHHESGCMAVRRSKYVEGGRSLQNLPGEQWLSDRPRVEWSCCLSLTILLSGYFSTASQRARITVSSDLPWVRCPADPVRARFLNAKSHPPAFECEV